MKFVCHYDIWQEINTAPVVIVFGRGVLVPSTVCRHTWTHMNTVMIQHDMLGDYRTRVTSCLWADVNIKEIFFLLEDNNSSACSVASSRLKFCMEWDTIHTCVYIRRVTKPHIAPWDIIEMYFIVRLISALSGCMNIWIQQTNFYFLGLKYLIRMH